MARIMMSEVTAELTPEELAEIEAAAKKEIIFDEDCPEMTEEMLRQFHAFDEIPVPIAPEQLRTVRSFGTNYRIVLGKLMNLALNDPAMIEKCVR